LYLSKFVGAAKLDAALLKRECEQALLAVSQGLVHTKQVDALGGLIKWTKSTFGGRRSSGATAAIADTRWMKPFLSVAGGQYEVRYRSHLLRKTCARLKRVVLASGSAL
jgi:hypothetical protein